MDIVTPEILDWQKARDNTMVTMKSLPTLDCIARLEGSDDRSWIVPVHYSLCRWNIHHARGLLDRILDPEASILVSDITACLPEDLRRHAWEGKAIFPNLRAKAAEFVTLIGGLAGFAQWHSLSREQIRLQHDLDDARCILQVLEQAQFVPFSAYTCEMAFDHYHERYASLDELNEQLEDPTFLEAYPWPFDGNKEELDVWGKAAETAARKANAPWFFGTTKRTWSGVSASEVRRFLTNLTENGESPSLRTFVNVVFEETDTSLDQKHYEDAYRDVKERPELDTILSVWFLHAGTGDEIDLALEERLSAWNSKQTIVSYHASESVVIGAFPDVTRDDVISWAQGRVDSARAAVDDVPALWRDPVQNPKAVIDEMALNDIRIDLPQGSEGVIWFQKYADDPYGIIARGPHLTLELAMEAIAAATAGQVLEPA